ncbi:MAG: hypothetical protein KDE27_27120, partial [Planctomycetes bacterium]|nr:hypothetical protein [Planctomycetota bacterium]
MSAPANGSKLQGAPEPADADALTALRSAWERGRGEHPDLEIAFDDFAAAASRRLRRRIGPVDEVADACVAGDLYLAIAGEIGRPGTAERLRDHVVPALRERAELAEPVVAEVFGDLATGERLAQYAGAGSLVGWLAVGARR